MKRTATRELYRSPNGDAWFLARDPATGSAFIRHQANAPAGGQVTDIEIGAFLSGQRHPEQDMLLRLIGTLIVDPQRADADDERSRARTGMEWSEKEMSELGGMLIRGLSIEEIAGLLRRDHSEVRDKVVEVGRACR
jgi:hypothetical protein